jgi:hypothetical protein
MLSIVEQLKGYLYKATDCHGAPKSEQILSVNCLSCQGCQMVYFQTKNPNVGKIWRALEWKMLQYFMTIWNILHPFGIMYGLWEWFVVIWYIFYILVCLDQEKSGNPV